jgi:predicted ATP-binding protein involved in virulence
MKNLVLKNFGPIQEANVTFGDLTLFVGPQASGKSIFLQLLKLIEDKSNIRKTLEQYNFVWSRQINENLDRYLGEGMHEIWQNNTEIRYDGKKIDNKFLIPKQGESYSDATENIFYIPAQRILSISDGRPRYFTEFDESTPYVLRHFSETLRQLLQNGISKEKAVFPQNQRLKAPLRNSFNESIFYDGSIVMDNKSGQKKLKMEIGGMSIPFMSWSAGQKEFMPLLLGFYWLCPASKISKRDSIKYVIIEEPEMGLHPKAIISVLLQVIDLLSRDYKVIISTHSPVLLEFAWAFKLLQEYKSKDDSLYELFDIKKSPPAKRLFEGILSKILKTYYFQRSGNQVIVKDISTLDAGSEDPDIAEWGRLSYFASKAGDIVSKAVSANE